MNRKSFFILTLVIATVLTGVTVVRSSQSVSAWPFNNTRALVFSGFPGTELGVQGAVIKLDKDDNLIVHGRSAGTAQVNPVNPAQVVGNGLETTDYIAKYSPNGDLLWNVQWLDVDGDFHLTDIALTSDGNIVVVGDINEMNYDIDPSPTGTRIIENGTTSVVLQLDTAGTLMWVREIEASTNTEIKSVSVLKNGNIVIGGSFEGTLSLDGPGGGVVPSFTASGNSDLYVAMFDSQGVEQWAASASTSTGDYVADIEVTPNDDVVVLTSLRGTVTQKTNDGASSTVSAPSSSNDTAMVWKLSSTGVSQWTAFPVIGTGTGEITLEIISRSDGTYLLTYTNSSHILSLSSNGDLLTTLQTEGSVLDVEELSSGDVIIVGSFVNTVDLDPTSGVDSKTSDGPYDDGFVTVLSPTLTYKSTRVYSGANHQRILDASPTSDDGYVITGWSAPTTLNLSTSTTAASFSAATGANSMLFIVQYNADGSTTVPLTSTPTTASYTPGNKKLTLQWTAMRHASRYVVTRAGTTVCDTTTTSCEVTGLRNGRASTYVITAYNSAGVASSSTTSVKAMAGFTSGVSTAKVRKKVALLKIVSTPSKGSVTWKVTSGNCKISGKRLVMPKKPGKCRLQMRVAKKRPYPAMSTTVVVSVTRR